MSDNAIYMIECDKEIPTIDNGGVIEHTHSGHVCSSMGHWHPVSKLHEGCGRSDDGVDSYVRICADCDCIDDVSLCHSRRRQFGLRTGYVAHYVSGMERTATGGKVEHIHDGYVKWHSVNIMHFGCRRVEDGIVIDSIMCGKCPCFDDSDMCLSMRERRGMNERDYFSHKNFAIGDKHPKSVDETDTLLMIDEAVAELVSAKSMIDSIGGVSEHVQQARFEQFVSTIDGIVLDLLNVSAKLYGEMDEDRNDIQ